MRTRMWLQLPVVLGIVLGDEERYGKLDEEGNFQELKDLHLEEPSILELLTGRLALEYPCKADLLDANDRAIAILYIGVVSGRAACVSVSALEGQELTGQVLRQAPISSLVREAAKGSLVHIRDGFAVRFADSVFSPMNEVPSFRQRRILDDEFMSSLAEVYRHAVSMGISTQNEIQRVFGPVSDTSARRWVMQARKRGYLGEAHGSWKAGEKNQGSS